MNIAVVLCAGFATRMHPLTKAFPKPLLEVAGRPVIDYLMDQLVELPGLESIYTDLVSNRSGSSFFSATGITLWRCRKQTGRN